MLIVKGDLFEAQLPAIGHGVNCQGVMGAGIAKQFASFYPEMVKKYKSYCDKGVLKTGMVWPWTDPNGKVIYNLATQNFPGKNAKLDYVEQSIQKMIAHAEEHNIKTIGLPKIGSGIGGLNWEEVEKIILDNETPSSVEIVIYVID